MLSGIFFFGSCYKQFEEDPQSIKFIRFKKRFVGKWELTKLAIDGNDVSSLMYVDSLKIYKYWHIKDYVRKNKEIYYNTNSTFELRTHDDKLVLDNSKNVVLHVEWRDKGNGKNGSETKEVILYFAKVNGYGLCCQKIDSTYSSGHKFSRVVMQIKKLTTNEMHLQKKEYGHDILNYHYYDMYFEKRNKK